MAKKPYTFFHADNCSINIGDCGHCDCESWKHKIEAILQLAKNPLMQVSTSKSSTTYTCHCGWTVNHPDSHIARQDFAAHSCPSLPILTCGCKGSVCTSAHNAPPTKSTRRILMLGAVITVNCRGCDEELFLTENLAIPFDQALPPRINDAVTAHRAAGCTGVL